MSIITFGTLKFTERLEKAGLTREQASAIAEAQREALAEALDTTLAKADIGEVKAELSIPKWMIGVLITIANFAKQYF